MNRSGSFEGGKGELGGKQEREENCEVSNMCARNDTMQGVNNKTVMQQLQPAAARSRSRSPQSNRPKVSLSCWIVQDRD